MKKRRFLFLFVAILGIFSLGYFFTSWRLNEYLGISTPEFDWPVKGVILPLEKIDNHYYIQATYRNSKFYMMVDTGANHSTVPSQNEKIKKLETKYKKYWKPIGIDLQDDKETQYVEIDSLSIGAGKLKNMICDLEEGETSLLGGNVLSQFYCVFDFVGSKLELHQKPPTVKEASIKVPFKYVYDNTPLIQVVCGNMHLNLLIDTGSNLTILDKSKAMKIGATLSAESTETENGTKVIFAHVPTINIQGMHVNTKGRKGMTVGVIEGIHKRFDFDGVLGLNFLSMFSKVIISFPKKEIIFVRRKHITNKECTRA